MKRPSILLVAPMLAMTSCQPTSPRDPSPPLPAPPPTEPRAPATAPPAPPPADAIPTATAPPAPPPLATWEPPDGKPASSEGIALPLLPRLFTRLARLDEGQRDDHVRIIWLGDSHTQPDIWTHALRRPLQERFGVGGPGFLHVGWKKWGYRHSGAKLSVRGPWRIEPPKLLSVETYGDGVLGLGGVRLIPRPGSSAGIDVKPEALPGPGRWELSLRVVSEDAALRVAPVGVEPVEVRHDAEQPGTRHVAWTSEGPGGSFEVTSVRGRVELFGVTVERTDHPGVVLDTLGLNGARVIHTLTWDEASWTAALARRKPDLLVLAYGTNESGIRYLSMKRHRNRLVALIDRARSGSPDLDCLIIGAMDRGGSGMSAKIERINGAQALAAQDRGCAFWSAQRAMGGKGAMQRWAGKDPPLAAPDRVHLKVRGYHRLGGMLARDLIGAFDAGSVVR